MTRSRASQPRSDVASTRATRTRSRSGTGPAAPSATTAGAAGGRTTATISSPRCGDGARRSDAGGLEQLDQVARRVLDEDLLAAGSADDLVAERDALGLQPFDLTREVVKDEVDPVPPSGS